MTAAAADFSDVTAFLAGLPAAPDRYGSCRRGRRFEQLRNGAAAVPPRRRCCHARRGARKFAQHLTERALFEVATNEPGFDRDEDVAHLGEALKLPSQRAHLRSYLEQNLQPIGA